VTEGLRVNSTLTYTDARLTKDALGLESKDGDQLPVSPAGRAPLIADYRRSLNESMSLLFGAGYRYRDMIVNQFSAASAAGSLPSRPQNIIDLKCRSGAEAVRASALREERVRRLARIRA